MKESWTSTLVNRNQTALKNEEQQILEKRQSLEQELLSLAKRLKMVQEALSFNPPATP
ncbi:hypothetical protein HYW46_05010 [Candidatus Daviesbacteria bacterium]|nr:hypothetical protein [Candidatus Daviesbacteria bacterium]